MNALDIFLSEFNSNSHPSSKPASEVNRRKWHLILGFWKFCYLILFSFNKTHFLPCQNILRSHVLSSSSVSLWISLLIISGRKPLMFSLSLSLLLNAIFLLLLWTVLLLDSLIAAISVYVTDQKWWEEKNARKKEAKYLEVLFGKDSKTPIWSVITSLLSLTCFTTIYI